MTTLSSTGRLLDGRALARRLLAEAAERVRRIQAASGAAPTLATVLVGDDPASAAYVRMKDRRCGEAGVAVRQVNLPAASATTRVVGAVAALGADAGVHALLVQHPVPAPIDRRAVFEAIPLAKDVDGVTSAMLGRTILGMPAFQPCTPAGIMLLLAEYGVVLRGVHAVVIGRSPILGRPMASLLINAHATVTLCHSQTRALDQIVRQADLVIAAVGRARFVPGAWIKPGAVVVDAGYNAGSVGDVEFEAAAQRAALITPVPGGVGPMTIAVLIQHVVRAAAEQTGVAL